MIFSRVVNLKVGGSRELSSRPVLCGQRELFVLSSAMPITLAWPSYMSRHALWTVGASSYAVQSDLEWTFVMLDAGMRFPIWFIRVFARTGLRFSKAIDSRRSDENTLSEFGLDRFLFLRMSSRWYGYHTVAIGHASINCEIKSEKLHVICLSEISLLFFRQYLTMRNQNLRYGNTWPVRKMITIMEKANKSRANGPRTSSPAMASMSMLYVAIASCWILCIERGIRLNRSG
jgi:hypothetical protein